MAGPDITFNEEGTGQRVRLGEGEEDEEFVMARPSRNERRRRARERRANRAERLGSLTFGEEGNSEMTNDFAVLGSTRPGHHDEDDAYEEEGEEEEEEEEEEGSDFDEEMESPGVRRAKQQRGNLGGVPGDTPSQGFESIEDEKIDLLNKLERLKAKGVAVGNLNMYSTIGEIRAEYKRITYSGQVDAAVRFGRRMLVTCCTGLEFFNTRFDPFDGAVNLEGWAESVHENIGDYDGVLEELYVKYRGRAKVAPEIKLMLMLGGSAATHHITTTMFKQVINEVNVGDILRNNPGLKEDMVKATKEAAPPDLAAKLDAFMAAGRPPTVSTRPYGGAPPTVAENPTEEDAASVVSDVVSDASSVSGGRRKKKVVNL